jgi:hypothetical protein
VTVLIRAGGEQTQVPGIVDSGADRTLLPVSVAVQLGIRDELIKYPRSAGGAAGDGFEIWRAPGKIEGRVVAKYLSGKRLWGPKLFLDPVFAATEEALFGRADFFAAFTITFWRDAEHGPVFQLEH